MERIRRHLTYANVVATLSLVLVLGGGTALASYVISSNSQVGPGTISGHQPPTGKHANVISGSVNAQDVADESLGTAEIKNGDVGSRDLAPAQQWQPVGPASDQEDLCADPSKAAVFCTIVINGPGFTLFQRWQNYGAGYASAGFYKDQLGIVHLKGVVTNPQQQNVVDTDRQPIFRLPVAYRPAHSRIFSSIGREDVDNWDVAPARVEVNPDGLVVFVQDCNTGLENCSANASYFTLDGISFRPSG
jgi:hypothetical protein